MKAKICLIGDRESDKTALIRHHVFGNFDDAYIRTLGTAVSKKTLQVRAPQDGSVVEVDIAVWDIMGQKGFQELLKEAYFNGTKGILAVCDCTRKATLDDLHGWIEQIFETVGRVPVVFLANKADLVDRRQITEENLKVASAPYGGFYYFSSTKTGEYVEDALKKLAEEIVAWRYRPPSSAS